jgi:hypothetical protein
MYLRDGIHTISLTVFDVNQSSTDSITVVVTNRAPVIQVFLNGTAIPDVTMLLVVENDTLVFDASSSSDPDGSDLVYNWTLDGEFIGSGQMVTITLSRGYHEIRLTVTDEDGRSSSFYQGLNCVKGKEPDGPPDADNGGAKPLSAAWYIVPSVLIILFIIIALIFFLLSREKSDVYFEE